mgnify:CR=1 FL=1
MTSPRRIVRSRNVLWAAAPALVVTAGMIAGGCGPSFQAIYEGDSRFEHCYALEENPQKPMTSKAECWRDWSERYTYGQTRDRIQYAIARYVALSQAPNAPTDEAMMMAAPGVTPRVSTITAPAPTNAFAPPPKTLEAMADGGPPLRPSEVPIFVGEPEKKGPNAAPAPASAPPVLPQASCGQDCEKPYRECNTGCDSDPKKKDAKCTTCEKTYRTCMRACFR